MRHILLISLILFIAACDDSTESAQRADMDPIADLGVDGSRPAEGEVVMASAQTRLVWYADEGRLALLRADRTLFQIPLEGLQLGLVEMVSEDRNYDPMYLFDGINGTSPPDLVWSTPSFVSLVSGDATARVELDYGEFGRGELAVTPVADDRLTLRLTPPEGAQVAFMRISGLVSSEEAFYGLGEVFDDVNHRGKLRPMQLELDTDIESANNEAHVPIPFLIGHHGWGLFVESLYPGAFSVAVEDDETLDVVFGTGMGSPDGLQFHLFTEDLPLDLTKHYYGLTGSPRLPAPWALGPWVWRDENENQAQVINDIETIRRLDLATSGYWVDRPYARAVNSFDWNPDQFDDPQAMIDRIHAMGFRFGLWHTPYVGAETLDNEDTSATEELRATANAEGYFPPSDGFVTSKWGRLVDLTNPEAYAWWQDLIRRYTVMGVEGFKLDYAEDVVPGLYLQRSGWGFFDGSTDQTMHARYQTLYHQVYAETLPETGGFLLCRSATWGGQTNGAIIWPGDLDANLGYHREILLDGDEEYMAVGGLPAAVVASISLGPSGFPFFGSDTGGYRRAPPNKETFVRWFEHTALSSVMQIGTNTNDVAWEATEENGFDDEVLDWYRIYTRLHLRLFPYEWTYAQEIASTGRPIQRPYGLQYPSEGKHPSDTYFFGDDLLVAPVIRDGQRSRVVPFPEGVWYDWWTGEAIEGGEDREVDAPLSKLPLYLRAGGIIPMLRPTIDTLSPTTEEDIESYANDAGRLYARIAPGGRHRFTLYDGSSIEQDTSGDEIMITTASGDVFRQGRQYELVGLQDRPVSVEILESEAIEAASAEALSEIDAGWFYEEGRRRLHIKVPENKAVRIQRAAEI